MNSKHDSADKSKIGVIVLTRNAGETWVQWLNALQQQRGQYHCLVIDTSSADNTVEHAKRFGLQVHIIRKEDFDHGGTRRWAASLLPDCEILVYLTQDAILGDECSLSNLIQTFDDGQVGAAYGRQLPHRGADPIEAHARLFNYPATSYTRELSDAPTFGIKTAFLSNSFAAYRRNAMDDAGGFPVRSILGEDMYLSARMLMKGWKIAYRANATVFHSHKYSLRAEFSRYFDIGVFHARESWIRHTFGKAGGEGARFVRSELRYLAEHRPVLIPSAVLRTISKWVGYQVGLKEANIPLTVKPHLSMHRVFWEPDKKEIASYKL